MFLPKKKFLKALMISVVCISFTCANNELGFKKCKHHMRKVFGQNTKPFNCIKNAIRYLQLYGQSTYIYDADVIKYYQKFHLKVNTDYIVLPTQFCFHLSTGYKLVYNAENLEKTKSNENYQLCMSQILMFEDYLGDEDLLPGDEDLLPGTSTSVQHTEAGSSEGTSVNNTKLNILKNALYYHKQAGPPPTVELTDEAKKYFHDYSSYGYHYLEQICENIIFIEDSMDNPMEYCKKEYPVPPRYSVSRKRKL